MLLADIDTRIGTKSNYTFSHGNTLALTGVPHGMNYLSVQTTLDDTSWWFDPQAKSFAGIRLTHQPSPWIGDFSSVLFTPLASKDQTYLGTYQDATFHPHELSGHAVEADVTYRATAGMYSGSLQLSGHTPLMLKVTAKNSHVITQTPTQLTLALCNFSGSEDANFTMYLTLALPKATQVTTQPDTVILEFATLETTLNFATSFISAELSRHNLDLRPYAAQLADTVAAWRTNLAKISVKDADAKHVALFEHNFYRALLFPMRFYELDAEHQPVHYDTTGKTVRPGMAFTNNGFWDTYKTLFPLMSLIDPQLYADMLHGFYNNYLETSFLPRWLSPDERGMMPGTMIDAVIADAAVKGIAEDLMPDLLQAMIQGATVVSQDVKYGREGLAEYLQLGYVPADIGESVNKTLDYAYSDWLISVVAKHLGQDKLAATYLTKSHNWQNLFDPQSQLMRPKDRNDQFLPDLSPTTWGNGYTEGSAWQNSFAVYQDLPGLIKASGGKQAFAKHLHHLVNQPATFNVGSYGQTIHEMRELAAQPYGQVAISNQPSFHLPYLFALADDAASGEVLIKTMLTHAFSAGWDGYPGDEDNGSMSSWVLFSMLGFYPVTPGSGEYVLGIPLLDSAVLHLPAGDLTITTENNLPSFNFVAQRGFNGDPTGATIKHHDLAQGGSLATRLQLLPH
ncbi:GH92 family glycosyl hydrolase [Lacticaseibacillus sp. N501-2]|uniref:GH92 family glycosyl hydrolase n=1 Tax=Lacticaseibacillus salsurae TaxID=3367729 RepID=UPI0038B29AD6